MREYVSNDSEYGTKVCNISQLVLSSYIPAAISIKCGFPRYKRCVVKIEYVDNIGSLIQLCYMAQKTFQFRIGLRV